MHGHGYGQPVKQPPHTAWLVLVRVLFVALGILSIGFLAWTMLLRLAAVTRRSLDWALFVAVLVADVLGMTLLALEPGDDVHTPGGYAGALLVLGTLAATIAYYLAADVRHFLIRQQAYAAPAPAYGYQTPAGPAGPAGPVGPAGPAVSAGLVLSAGPATPYGATAPAPPAARPAPAAPLLPPTAPHLPPPARPAPARIDQVRAELDELSDYLRKRDGHEGGR
ncbi:hypothetical protein ACH4PW_12305 [Streptomyces sp. NPDC017082]|uniref:hypothetical protein n=1 Tax=Streptomyces sp. NPDC017082 TaxID=3364974 RepID=UPI0037B8EAEE